MKKQVSLLRNFLCKLLFAGMILILVLNGFVTVGQANKADPPEEPSREGWQDSDISIQSAIQTGSGGIAWGDPNGQHSVYDWPYSVVQMGLVIQSYQNYSSGTSAAYFHHGIDMVAPNGTDVFTRSGGQVVNVENYQLGNSLYWEVAILDPEGYVWQYHHIDRNTIPQLILNKYSEWQTNPNTGGFIPPNTYIGDIVYWPVVSLGYRFNHIHLNILAAGDKYINPLEFHTPLIDNQIPEIQGIGLLNGDTLVSGNTASGNYGLYVRAWDLFMSLVYYLPPYKTEFSIDGGEWITVWEFHDLPGGSSDTAYVNDFFVPVYTKGDYNYRDFYIDLGFTTSGQRAFPTEPGEHTIEVRVWDYSGNTDSDTFSWNVVSPIPDNGCSTGNGVTKIFNINENLLVTDVNLGVNISHPTRGQVRVTLKSPSDSSASIIINSSSDSYDNYDVWIDDTSTNPINDGNNDNTAEPYFDRITSPSTDGSLDNFNGKTTFGEWTVFICDNTSGTTGTVNLIELEISGINDDNSPPIADPLTINTLEDTPFNVTLSGSDSDNDPLTFFIVDSPVHGTLSGTIPELIYIPDLDYNGVDSLTYKASDGIAESPPAMVDINIIPVNDAPNAEDQSIFTEINTSVAVMLEGSDVENDLLSFRIVEDPTNGSLSGIPPSLQYTPTTNYYGSDYFTYIVNDGILNSSLATVTIMVDPPGPISIFQDDFETNLGWVINPNGTDTATLGLWERAIPQSVIYSGYTTQLGTTVSGSYDLVTGPLAGSSAGAYDIDNGVTSIRSPNISLPANHELTLTFYYYLAHLNNATSADYFRVKVIGDTTETVFEKFGTNTYVNAVWQFVDVDLSHFNGQTIYLLIEAADAGTASLVEAGVDDVSIKAFTTNIAPIADPQSIATDEDTPVSITLTGSDIDGDLLSYVVVTGPIHGSLDGIAPDLTYTPDANYHGTDSFTFLVNDGLLDSTPATVSITLNPVNDPPVADPQSIPTNQNTPVAITLTGSDVDGDPLSFNVSLGPLHGTLSGEAPDVTYSPDPGYSGSDSFEFTVSDGQDTSAPALVSIAVTMTNAQPAADDQSVSTDEDTPISIVLTGSDPDGDPLSFAIVNQPSNGILSGDAPNLVYTPLDNFNGFDSLTFVVDDSQVVSDPATITININPVNDPPVADPQSITTDEDTPVSITLTGSDIDGDQLSFVVITGPIHGSLDGIAPDLTYTPDANYHGTDSFTFLVNDGLLDSTPATVSITLNPVNDPPVADPQSIATDEDTPVSITLTGSDVDGDLLSYVVVTGPIHGSLDGIAPNLTYTPDANYHGTDSFTFLVNDGLLDSTPATVSITLNPVNDPPVADPQSIPTNQNTPAAITLTGSDVDGDPLSFNVSLAPLHGTLNGEVPDVTYSPDPGYSGTDSFEFTVSDGQDTSTPALVSITVTETNARPVAEDQSVSTNEDTPVAIMLTGSDPDGDPLSFAIVTQPSNGALSGDVPNLVYTPLENFNSFDSFTFVIDDSQLVSDPATVSISINPVNDPPAITAPQDQTIYKNSVLIFSGDKLIAVSDIDVNETAGGELEVTLTVENGTLNLSQTSNLIFSLGDGIGDASMTFTGSLDAINPALDGMTFTPNKSFVGFSRIMITINDLGNTGEGGESLAISSFYIEIMAKGGGSGKPNNYLIRE